MNVMNIASCHCPNLKKHCFPLACKDIHSIRLPKVTPIHAIPRVLNKIKHSDFTKKEKINKCLQKPGSTGMNDDG
jgi:hypothetical protein